MVIIVFNYLKVIWPKSQDIILLFFFYYSHNFKKKELQEICIQHLCQNLVKMKGKGVYLYSLLSLFKLNDYCRHCNSKCSCCFSSRFDLLAEELNSLYICVVVKLPLSYLLYCDISYYTRASYYHSGWYISFSTKKVHPFSFCVPSSHIYYIY